MKKGMIVAMLVCVGLGALYFATRESQVRVGIKELSLPLFDVAAITKVAFSGKTKFELKKSGDAFLLELNEGGKSRDVAASKEALKQLFDAIAGVKGGIFITEQIDKQDKFKVTDAKGQRVTLFIKDKPVWELIIGDYADEGGRYVRVPSQNAVFLSKARFWDITRSNVNDFRERMIVGLGSDAIKAVRLEKGESEGLSVARDEKELWSFDAKTALLFTDLTVSRAKAAEFANAVASLRAASFVETPEALKKAKALLNASGERVVVSPKGSGSELVLALADDPREKKAYAIVQGNDAVFEISEYAYGQLSPSFEEIKEGVAAKTTLQHDAGIEIPRGAAALPPEVRRKLQEAAQRQQE